MTKMEMRLSEYSMLAMKTSTDITNKNVSRETLTRLDEYAALLLKWNAKINLIGPATEAHICKRHLEDSAQLVMLIPAAAKTLVDLGSGAGLPGMVIAIYRPDLSVTLVERDQRKAAFLTEVKSRLGVANVKIRNADIASVQDRFDVVTARALAPLAELFGFAEPLMGQGATCLFLKGVGVEKELAKARENWEAEYTQISSATQEGASIISISQLIKKRTENR